MHLLNLDAPDAPLHERDKILSALDCLVRPQPVLDPDSRSYRALVRASNRHLRDARAMLEYVADTVMPAETLLTAFRAYDCGRLRWDGQNVRYMQRVAGHQHFPTEYRRGVCEALAGAIRDDWLAERAGQHVTPQLISSLARRAFRPCIAKRWFS